MSSPVNMVQIVRDLPSRSRGRACVVLTHNHQGQKEWATELAQQTDAEHINLLELFAQDNTLGDRISEFLVPVLFDFLKTRSQASVLIISGLEFLKATWIGGASVMEQFASRLENWNEHPSLLFVLQYDKTLATRKFHRFSQYAFVVDQKETLAL